MEAAKWYYNAYKCREDVSAFTAWWTTYASWCLYVLGAEISCVLT